MKKTMHKTFLQAAREHVLSRDSGLRELDALVQQMPVTTLRLLFVDDDGNEVKRTDLTVDPRDYVNNKCMARTVKELLP